MITSTRLPEKMHLGEILDYSVEIYRRNFKKLTLLSLIFYVPYMILYTWIISSVSGDFAGFMNFGIQPEPDIGDSSQFLFMFFGFYAVIMMMGLINAIYTITLKPVFDASVSKIVYDDVVNEEKREIKPVIRDNFKKMGSLLVNQLLYHLIRFGVSAAAVIILYILLILTAFGLLGATSLAGMDAGPGAIILTVLVVILFILLILATLFIIAYATIRFGFGIQAVAIEGRTSIEGLSRSLKLSSKNFWHLFLGYGLGYLLIYIVPSILGGGAYILMFINKSFYILLTVAAQLVGSLIYPYLTTLVTLQFINMKIKKEGLDLEVLVDTLLTGQKHHEVTIEGGE